MITTSDDIIKRVQDKIGDNADDETISIIEDIKDTFTDFENKTDDTDNWKSKYDENDKMWRKKYLDRFTSKEEIKEDTKEDVKKDNEELTYNDLFEEREGK